MKLMRDGVNPVVVRILSSRIHAVLSGSTAVIRFRGRKTGRSYATPVNYVLCDDDLYVVPGHHEQKRWWRNLLIPSDVEVVIRGRIVRGRAMVLAEGDGARYEEALGGYLDRFPRAGKAILEKKPPVVRVTLSTPMSKVA